MGPCRGRPSLTVASADVVLTRWTFISLRLCNLRLLCSCCRSRGSSLALHLYNLITQLLHLLHIRCPNKTHPAHDRLQMRAPDAYGQPMPPHDAHPNAGQRMRLQIPHPPIHDLRVRVERLDGAHVDAPLKVLLRLFVRERPAGHGPERAPRREGGDSREGDAERGGGVRGKVRGELDGLVVVRAELDGRDGDAVRPGVLVCFEDTAPVDDLRVPLALFGVYAYTSESLDRRRRGSGGGGNSVLWVGWGAGKILCHENEGTQGSASTHVEDSVSSESFGVLDETSPLVLTQM
jgi:hypothetical protein